MGVQVSTKPAKTARGRRSIVRSIEFEQLESRVMLAADVELVNGDLVITETGAANNDTIFVGQLNVGGNNIYWVAGNVGSDVTTTTGVQITPTLVAFNLGAGTIDDLLINYNTGNDSVTLGHTIGGAPSGNAVADALFTNAAAVALQVGGNLSVALGEGIDQLLAGVGRLNVGGSANVTLGEGLIGVTNLQGTTIGANVSVLGGSNSDIVVFNGATVGGGLHSSLFGGNDFFFAVDSTVGGNTNVDLGSLNDLDGSLNTLLISNTRLTREANLTGGVGNTFLILNGTEVGTAPNQDALRIFGGREADTVVLSNGVLLNEDLLIDTAGGDDVVVIGGGAVTQVRHDVEIFTRDGNDTVIINGLAVGTGTFTDDNLDIYLGDGNDTLTIANTFVLNRLRADGGAGVDTGNLGAGVTFGTLENSNFEFGNLA